MAKDPAFLFYANDWIGGTMGMTLEEKGAYIELLILQFNRGHMTSHMIGQVLGQKHGQLWDTLKDKFIQDENGLYYNKRLDEEKLKRQKYAESRRNNVKGLNQYSKKNKKYNTHINGHMTSHMENENVNEDVNDNLNKKGGVGENFSDSEIDLNLLNEILEYFDFNEIRNQDKKTQVYHFLKILHTDNQTDNFKEQFIAYKKYKESSKEIKHGFANFLGTIEERYLDGGWNAQNWQTKSQKTEGENKHFSPFNSINYEKADADNNWKFEVVKKFEGKLTAGEIKTHWKDYKTTIIYTTLIMNEHTIKEDFIEYLEEKIKVLIS
jgi:uncharacterized protein YdaU (DUF1376 family)